MNWSVNDSHADKLREASLAMIASNEKLCCAPSTKHSMIFLSREWVAVASLLTCSTGEATLQTFCSKLYVI